MFDKGSKTIQWGKDSFFKKWCWGHWTSTFKRMKLDSHITPCMKIHSKWIKDWDGKPKTMKLLEENFGSKLHSIGFGDEFLDQTPKAQATENK